MLLKSVPKHSEFTYGVHPSFVAEHLGLNAAIIMANEQEVIDTLKLLEPGMMGAVRSLIAKHDLLRQLIGYGLTFKAEPIVGGYEIFFAVYKRNKSNGEGQLSSKFSLGVGGHGEHMDVSPHYLREEEGDGMIETGTLDLYETTDKSIDREYREEIKIISGGVDVTVGVNISRRPIGFVLDTKPTQLGYVGNHHFGTVYASQAPAGAAFEMIETMNEAVCWASAEQLRNDPIFKGAVPFEPWSQMLVDVIDKVEAALRAWVDAGYGRVALA